MKKTGKKKMSNGIALPLLRFGGRILMPAQKLSWWKYSARWGDTFMLRCFQKLSKKLLCCRFVSDKNWALSVFSVKQMCNFLSPWKKKERKIHLTQYSFSKLQNCYSLSVTEFSRITGKRLHKSYPSLLTKDTPFWFNTSGKH